MVTLIARAGTRTTATMRHWSCGVPFLVLLGALAGCSDSTGTLSPGDEQPGDSTGTNTPGGGQPRVAARARLLNGPAVIASPSAALFQRAIGLSIPTAGRWTISPDQARVTIRSLRFINAAGEGPSVELSNCNATYLRSSATLSQLLDCPFEVSHGTYVGVGVTMSSSFSLLIDDSEAGFFSDPASPTRLATTRPAGGPQFVSYTVPQQSEGNPVLFARPLVVDSATARTGLTISLVIDMIHTVFVNVAGGVATMDETRQLPPVSVIPFLGAPGRAEFYTPTATARSTILSGPTSVDLNSVRLYYDAAGVPVYLWSVNSLLPATAGSGLPASAWNATPASGSSGSAQRSGGFLGLDSSGTLCWAVPTDYTYREYAQIRTMRPQSTLGGTTTLAIQQTPNVPSPTSGDTYASGCPSIVPGQQETLTLVAK